MSVIGESDASEKEDRHAEVQAELAHLVQLSLLQLSDMKEVREQLKLVTDRLSKVTPYQREAKPREN